MIKVSKLADYAVVVLSALSKSDGALMAASTLSSVTHIPEPTVAKVTKKLAKAGIIESIRGANGGYKLAQSPEHLSVYTIIAAIDGPLELTDCVTSGDHECSFSFACPSLGRWDKVNAAIQNTLEEVKLSDMVRPDYELFVQKDKNKEGAEEAIRA